MKQTITSSRYWQRLLLVWMLALVSATGYYAANRAVDSTARGQRVEQQSMAANQARATIWGYIELRTVAQRDNELVYRFYEERSFTLVHEERMYHL